MFYRLACALAVLSGLLLSLPADAGDLAPSGDTAKPPADPVVAALQAELDGDNAARQQRLRQALATSAEAPAAYWHAGRVSGSAGEWLDYRDVPPERLAALEEYRSRRDVAGETVADLLALADWCHERDMADTERAHLHQVLEQDPDHPQARERLGHIRLQGLWITPEQIARAQQRSTERQASLEQFGATIVELLKRLDGSTYERNEARQTLMDLRDPAAIPAMERLLARTPETQMLLIDWLDQIDLYEATQAMARTALRTDNVEVQRAAAARLRDRPFDHFVPVLLGAMKTPVTMKSRVGISPDGWYVLEQYFEAETEHERRQLVRPTHVAQGLWICISRIDGGIRAKTFPLSDRGDLLSAQHLFFMRKNQGEQQRLEWTRRIRQINQRAEVVLRHVTGDTQARGPDDWWERWAAHNGMHSTGDKPLLRVVQDPERVYVDQPTKELTQNRVTVTFGNCTCFAAGTPVWTERGAIPIEQIAVGDRVLSQDVDTGELAYQPVLGTTVRPPAPQFRLATDSFTLQGTGGHPIWVNGQGWRLLRDLEPGMLLHGTAGAQPILDVAPAEDAEAYNLIVADFHTYFVGEGTILCHDNTPREPTNALVPGLLSAAQ